MKILSWNVNGLRSVYKKGFLKWFYKTKADILCLQEIKAQDGQIPEDLKNIEGYNAYFSFAEKKGYSGTAVYAKTKPISIEHKLGLNRFDKEGRILKLEYPGFTLLNVYIPHGGRQKENLNYKLEVYDYLLKFLESVRNKPVVLIGDFNVAHKEIDLARPKQNKNNIMFTNRERKQIDRMVDLDFSDTFRKFEKRESHYTWWPYFANARERNLGWRIDYVFASVNLISKVKKAFILEKVRGSDHCPVGIEMKMS